MRGPSAAWQLVETLAEVCEELLDAHGRTISLDDVNRLRKKLGEVKEAVHRYEECEAP
jgi:hypothetical protein